jgi:S-layer protein
MANADGINVVSTQGASAGTLAISNAADGFTLLSNALSSANTTVSLLNDLGTDDTVNLAYKATNGFTDGTTTKTVANVENIVITTTDSDKTAATTPFTSIITADSAVTVTVSGNAGFNASTGLGATTLTSFDASGVTATGAGGAVTLTTGALAAAADLKGGAGTNTINAALATKAVTITGGAGLDALSGGAGDDVINGGDGGTTGVGLVGGAGADTITGGSGTDTITGGAGADTLTGGAGADTFVFTTAGGISTATSMDVITDLTVGATGDSVTLIDQGTEVGGSGTILTATVTDVSIAGTILEALNLVSGGNGGTNGIVNWFQFGGDTYLVNDLSASTSFVNGTDQVIKITGLVDLDGGTGTTDNLLLTFA